MQSPREPQRKFRFRQANFRDHGPGSRWACVLLRQHRADTVETSAAQRPLTVHGRCRGHEVSGETCHPFAARNT